MAQPKLLIISHDVVGKQMAGPGIRYYHLARILSRTTETILAIPDESPPDFAHPEFAVIYYSRREWTSIAGHYAASDVCLIPSDIAADFPQIGADGDETIIIIDGYNPLMAEWLALSTQLTNEQADNWWQGRLDQLSRQYTVGDFFICASERQRDWWIGLLEANRRLNTANFRMDPSFRKLIDVVPYGLPETPFVEKRTQPSKPIIKGVWPAIAPTDKVLLWGGGLWSWLDPLTAIHALAKVWETRQDVKLIFPGTKHPNPMLKNIPTQNDQAYQTAEMLGLLDKGVFFGDWVPYKQWVHVLAECDLALTLHYDTIETRLAFRSRVLEYIWAGLPTIATRGDSVSEIIQSYQIGTVVDFGDVDGVAQAIHAWLAEPHDGASGAFQRAQEALMWSQTAKPLIAFCENPYHAADRTKRVNAQDDVQLAVQEAHVTDTETTHQHEPLIAELNRLQSQVEQLSVERTQLQNLVHAYEQGRFIRLMKWLDQNLGERFRGFAI
ncbi:MAG: glycosyltransferase [Chloroflexota bacterium]